MSIFDSLVLDSRTTGLVRLRPAIAGLRRDEIRSGFQNAISQRKLNCALSVYFLWKKD